MFCKASMPIIYAIWADDARLPYYGSTIKTLARRKSGHKSHYKSYIDGKEGRCMSFDLFDAVGFENCVFEIVEQLPDDISKDNLRLRERWFFENCPCINAYIPIATNEELINSNRQRCLQYYKTHKEQKAEYDLKYRARKKAELAKSLN